MVPGSTLIYGSSFNIATLRPRASSIAPSEAEARPFPREDTTPPVTNTNRVIELRITRRVKSLPQEGRTTTGQQVITSRDASTRAVRGGVPPNPPAPTHRAKDPPPRPAGRRRRRVAGARARPPALSPPAAGS